MKVKVLQRSEREYLGESGSVHRHFRNPDPQLHPFERAREYQRALVAVKMEKIFAKPFICALDGHTDSVKCLTVARHVGAPLVTGSCDGELRLWSLQHLTSTSSASAHQGFVRDVTTDPSGSHVFSCGDDKCAKMWAINENVFAPEPVTTYHSVTIPNSIDHHWTKPMFLTTGGTVDVWDHNRSAPLSSFEWGCESIIAGRFNPAEPALIASTAADRSIGLYDLRGNSAIRKVILKMRSNAVAWNPYRPLHFTVANEDSNLYTFDMRKLSAAIGRHWDHTMAVLDVSYSPSGQEFLSASYDATVRLWSVDEQRSKEVYHTKRMQRVLCCLYSPDGRFVITGSEDANVRLWKAKKDQKLGTLTEREKRAVAYREALKSKFQRLPEIKRIKRHTHVPKMIKRLSEKRRIMRDAGVRKEQNRRKHSRPGSSVHVSLKKRQILKEEA
mmetsp:Transcript_53801/g.144057  ORF Transcript_53801/g.144057 Transcript_53801/m.144057 type:complete len:443 (-) Transcript_53801:182-1510(-)|eukprot:CAMPEP_0194489638 /NCGR_PEP_ID=MMETSP0253-20130528/9109_1 /TAXON_ID=2966 /ORGANISM="Noctiluca scintillans" /LENGTH=442 /DNA_ID=CAMNT_0039330135 /DNA_START=59 /DNA_END=1387 /DNA_ORIENTATION=-